MTARISAIGITLVLCTATGVGAQQQLSPSLAEVAQRAEAAKPTVKKAKRTYTNGDLSADPRGERAPVAAADAAISKTQGAPVAGAEPVTPGEPKVETDAVPQQSEAQWRPRADSVRKQIARHQARLAALTKPNAARDANAGAKARNDTEVANVQDSLDAAKKQWESLEGAAMAAKIPMAWLEPRPVF